MDAEAILMRDIKKYDLISFIINIIHILSNVIVLKGNLKKYPVIGFIMIIMIIMHITTKLFLMYMIIITKIL